MSTPVEELRSTIWSYYFLCWLLRTKRVPQKVRDEARRLSRHYPHGEKVRFIFADTFNEFKDKEYILKMSESEVSIARKYYENKD